MHLPNFALSSVIIYISQSRTLSLDAHTHTHTHYTHTHHTHTHHTHTHHTHTHTRPPFSMIYEAVSQGDPWKCDDYGICFTCSPEGNCSAVAESDYVKVTVGDFGSVKGRL
jgi:hypothetical protein